MPLKAKLKKEYFEKLLIKLNLSANEFGRKAGLSSAYMSQPISGQGNPSGRTRQKIMDYLNQVATVGYVEFDDLFEIENGE